jgi:hypothetical protein
MRTIVLVAIALVGMSWTTTFADAGTWCATYRLGSTNCGYSSSEERCAALGVSRYPIGWNGKIFLDRNFSIILV